MLRNHEFQQNKRISNSSNAERGCPNSHVEEQIFGGINQFPIKKIKHQRNVIQQQNFSTVTPLSAKKSNNSNEYAFHLFVGDKQQKEEERKIPLSRLDENRNQTIQSLLKKLQSFNQRLQKNQKQIEKLRTNDSQYMKKHQFIELTSILKDYKNINKRTQTTNKQTEILKSKIDTIRNQIGQCVIKKEFDGKMESIQWKIKEYSVNKSIQSEVEKVIASTKVKVNEIINEFIENSKKTMKDYLEKDKILNRSTIFANRSIKLSHSERIGIYNEKAELGLENKQKEASIIQQNIYYIDYQGYLLDYDKCYLVDDHNKLVKLSNKEIDALKKINVLCSK